MGRFKEREIQYTRSPKLSIWKTDGEAWYVDKEDLMTALAHSMYSENDIKRRLGVGYVCIDEALSGQHLDMWAVLHIESGIL